MHESSAIGSCHCISVHAIHAWSLSSTHLAFCFADFLADASDLGQKIVLAAVEAFYVALISRLHCQQLRQQGFDVHELHLGIQKLSSHPAAQLTLCACIMRLVTPEMEDQGEYSVSDAHYEAAHQAGILDIVCKSIRSACQVHTNPVLLVIFMGMVCPVGVSPSACHVFLLWRRHVMVLHVICSTLSLPALMHRTAST